MTFLLATLPAWFCLKCQSRWSAYMSVWAAVNLMLHRQHWFPEYSFVTTLS